ncbi:GNAT family N-acetyltransferase [Isoptericola sp. NPDC057559]|uniref:GNAT family N-acetyltransferase n=1 Tax=Isoptericola sp. NPDC057559 TaxID=3346168 RepID=UPI0036CF0038
MTARPPPPEPERRLVPPTTGLARQWHAGHDDWGPGLHEDGFGLGPDDDVESVTGFADWVGRVRSAPAATLWWIVVVGDDGAPDIVGGIALRHPDHPDAARHGHIGYGVRPGARGRGHAAWALARVLEVAATQHGMDHADLVCEEGNTASAGLIEKLGGRVVDHPHPGVVRYRVPLAPR